MQQHESHLESCFNDYGIRKIFFRTLTAKQQKHRIVLYYRIFSKEPSYSSHNYTSSLKCYSGAILKKIKNRSAIRNF